MYAIRDKRTKKIIDIAYTEEGLLFRTNKVGKSHLFRNGKFTYLKDRNQMRIVPIRGTKLIPNNRVVVVPYEYRPWPEGHPNRRVEEVYFNKFKHMNYYVR